MNANVFFGELKEESAVFRFTLKEGGEVFLNLMTPAVANPEGRFDLVLVNESQGIVTAVLEAGSLPWEEYRDKKIAESFFRGPRLSMNIPSGDYRIVVSSNGNLGKFALQVGAKDQFSLVSHHMLYTLAPTLKRDFFGTPRVSFLFSTAGLLFVALYFIVGSILGFLATRQSAFIRIWEKLWGRSSQVPLFRLVVAVVCMLVSLLLFALAVFVYWGISLFISSGLMFALSILNTTRVYRDLRAA